VFLAPSDAARVQALWRTLADAAGYKGRAFAPHLTLGQAHAPWELGFLQEKGEALLRNYTPAAWDVGSVIVLRKDEADGGKMKVVEEIPLDAAAFAPSTIVPETPLTYDMASGHLCSMAEHLSDLPEGRIGLTTFNVLTDDTHSPANRFALLKRDMLSLPADILCLQEVPDALLPLLLDDADILARFAHCTHAPNSVLPNRQNIVVLSSANLPFAWSIVSLGESKRKRSAVLTFGGSRRLVLAVVHLTAGHEPAPVTKRAAELAELVSYLRVHHAEDSWIIAGDTNLDTDGLPEACADVLTDTWAMLHPNDAGLTYEPGRNALAAETVKAVRDPYRYDRVLVRGAGGVHAAEIAVLRSAPGEPPASDHWALHAILDVSGTLAPSAATVVSAQVESASQATAFETPAKGVLDDSVRSEEDSRLEATVRAAGGYPSQEQETARNHAFDVLRMALGGSTPSSASAGQPPAQALPAGVKLVLELVGSRALSVDTASSDLDVLAVGNLGQGTFFELARSRIRTWRRACEANGGSEVVLKRFVRDAAVPMMRLAVGGVEIDLQYAPAAKVVER
jgi:endonuclease/exonuclease/phosphatase family metal-dependent hydrolase